jgi:hypothetical protein
MDVCRGGHDRENKLRSAELRLLSQILAHRDDLKSTERLSQIRLNRLLESEPEARYWLYAPGAAAALAPIARPEMPGGTLALNDALRPLHALLLVGLALGGGWLAHALAARVTVYLGQAS